MESIIHRLASAASELFAIASVLDTENMLDRLQIPSDLNARHGKAVRELSAREQEAEPHWGMLANQAYRERRIRDRIFDDPALFGEAAWDILLDLLAAEMTGTRLSVSSACIGSNVPSTTALRWLTILEERGLISRESDVSDRRRAFVRITPDGVRKMKSFFSAIRKMDSL